MTIEQGITEQLRAIADQGGSLTPDQIRGFAAAMEARHVEAVTRPIGDVAGWASEATLTIAVTAGARAAYAEEAAKAAEDYPPWEELPPMAKYNLRVVVAPGIFAAFAAAPDLRRQAWIEGMDAALAGESDSAACPYPEPDL